MYYPRWAEQGKVGRLAWHRWLGVAWGLSLKETGVLATASRKKTLSLVGCLGPSALAGGRTKAPAQIGDATKRWCVSVACQEHRASGRASGLGVGCRGQGGLDWEGQVEGQGTEATGRGYNGDLPAGVIVGDPEDSGVVGVRLRGGTSCLPPAPPHAQGSTLLLPPGTEGQAGPISAVTSWPLRTER